eukprot:UN01713
MGQIVIKFLLLSRSEYFLLLFPKPNWDNSLCSSSHTLKQLYSYFPRILHQI